MATPTRTLEDIDQALRSKHHYRTRARRRALDQRTLNDREGHDRNMSDVYRLTGDIEQLLEERKDLLDA